MTFMPRMRSTDPSSRKERLAASSLLMYSVPLSIGSLNFETKKIELEVSSHLTAPNRILCAAVRKFTRTQSLDSVIVDVLEVP